MEFSSVLYFSLCSIISMVSLMFGFNFLDKAAIRIPEILIIYIKFFFFSKMIYTSSYALLVRPLLERTELNCYPKLMLFYQLLLFAHISVNSIFSSKTNYLSKFLLAVLGLPPFTYFCFHDSNKIGNFVTGFLGPLIIYPNHTICWILINNMYFLLGYIHIYFICSYNYRSSSSYSNFCSYSASYFQLFLEHWLLTFLIVWLHYWCHVGGPFIMSLDRFNVISYARSKQKTVDAVFGLIGILVAQYFTKENSGFLVLTLLSFAVSWLANIAMIRPVKDWGVFSFLICASLDRSTDLFGFRSSYTWIVFGFAVLLVMLRGSLDSISLQYKGMQEIVVRDWKLLEQEFVLSIFDFIDMLSSYTLSGCREQLLHEMATEGARETMV